MEDIITVNGAKYRRIDNEVDEPKVSERAKTGYERAEDNEMYYWSAFDGNVIGEREQSKYSDLRSFEAGNYYASKEIAKNNARADTLMRRLRQWQALHDKPVDWNGTVNQYTIGYDYDSNLLFCHLDKSFRKLGNIYFSSETKVSEVMKIFKDDLIWYFTEYKQRADG